MTQNSTLNLAMAVEQLSKHRLKALFTQSLGWQPVERSRTTYAQLDQPFWQWCKPLACREGVVVWQMRLSEEIPFSSALRQQIYGAIAQIPSTNLIDAPIQCQSPPLVIFVNAAKTRSLWCQSPVASALYISSQLQTLWEFRLRRLAQSSSGLFASLNVDQAEAGYKIFENLLKGLCEGISGISNRADRQEYAALTLRRLMFVQSLQKKGWLDGDTWYLQNRFGLAQGENFFKTYLQPLYQGLALPMLERPLPLHSRIGSVPFLGHCFEAHRLERLYEAIDICDQPFEEILGWLSEQSSSDSLNPWMSRYFGYWLERYGAQQNQASYMSSLVLRSDSDRPDWPAQVLDRLLIHRLNLSAATETTLNDLLFNADVKLYRLLIQEILPALRMLDPACGSGNWLVSLYQRLTEIFSILIGCIEQTQDTQLEIWRAGLVEQRDSHQPPNLLQSIQKRILKNNLYGVDISAIAAETSQFQLLLHTVATAQQPPDIEPLADLSFNILSGNALVGFIDVDEARFDQINRAGAGEVLQGNLLQPLAADSYQTTLAEKNLALEHYKTRNQRLAEARSIPIYARAALLREDILRLDAKAQHKLDNLLLNYMAQQLGIQYKAAQLTDKPQRRSLALEDIDVLKPFHWGYHFHAIIRRGGFDLVVCAPPWGAFKPTTEEFSQRFQDLTLNEPLKTSKQALAKGNPDVTQAWLFYQDQYAYVADYFYRSEQYGQQNMNVNGKSRYQLMRDRLFTERCFSLLAPNGMGAVALSRSLENEEKAKALYQFLQANTQFSFAQDERIGSEAGVAIWQMR
jgi:hypothetical protein